MSHMARVNADQADAQRTRCDESPKRMAKAELAELAVRTLREERAAYGAVLRRASELVGMNRDQTAQALGAAPAQISRWWSGDENPQVFRYYRHPRLRAALRLAEALTDDRVHVETIIRQKVS